TVAGAGLTGIETAAEVAAARPDLAVRLVGPELGASLSDSGRARAARGLAELGVEIVRDTVEPARSEADLVLWAVASAVPDLAARSGFEVDGAGRVLVDAHLRSVRDPRVFAAGDGAAVPGTRMSCQAAMPQGAYVGGAVAREATGRPLPRPFSMSFTGQCVSLGRRDGVIQLCRRDDSPTRLRLAGHGAAVVKEQVCRATVLGARTAVYAWLPGKR
ncbi:FAD-dependent oxidoreductase, partial [Tsukamurella soli]